MGVSGRNAENAGSPGSGQLKLGFPVIKPKKSAATTKVQSKRKRDEGEEPNASPDGSAAAGNWHQLVS